MDEKIPEKKLLEIKAVLHEIIEKKRVFPESKEVAAIRKAAKSLPPSKQFKNYENKHDELADLLIGLQMGYSQDVFSQFPDIDALTVFYVIQRLNKGKAYENYWSRKAAETRKSEQAREAKKVKDENFKLVWTELKTYWENNLTHITNKSEVARRLEKTDIFKNSIPQPKQSVIAQHVKKWLEEKQQLMPK